MARPAATLLTRAVATPSKPPTSHTAARSKVEIIKQESDYLRHPLMEELVSEATSINEPAQQLMKFHGSYMQDHREKRAFGEGKYYQFMMRTRQPAGKVTNKLYLTMDDLADQYGNGTLRLTTRQTYQLHGVLKGDLKTVFSSVIRAMGSTLGACGDVNRNVCAPPVPFNNRPEYLIAQKVRQPGFRLACHAMPHCAANPGCGGHSGLAGAAVGRILRRLARRRKVHVIRARERRGHRGAR